MLKKIFSYSGYIFNTALELSFIIHYIHWWCADFTTIYQTIWNEFPMVVVTHLNVQSLWITITTPHTMAATPNTVWPCVTGIWVMKICPNWNYKTRPWKFARPIINSSLWKLKINTDVPVPKMHGWQIQTKLIFFTMKLQLKYESPACAKWCTQMACKAAAMSISFQTVVYYPYLRQMQTSCKVYSFPYLFLTGKKPELHTLWGPKKTYLHVQYTSKGVFHRTDMVVWRNALYNVRGRMLYSFLRGMDILL
jgi:hypothetical protein